MKALLIVAEISKQAMWKYRQGELTNHQVVVQAVGLINETRKNHKRMGCRTMYFRWKHLFPLGRDAFERIGFLNGYKLKIKRNMKKTTWSQRVEVFPNLIEGIEFNGINQLFQSDIFYFVTADNQEYYGVTIEDVYSRKLLALHLSQSMQATENIKALRKVFKLKKGQNLEGCIFHSDRGTQFISNIHKKLLRDAGMQISMCIMAQQNAYVERIQGTIKNDYMYEHHITGTNIQSMTRKIQHWYNSERPHKSLGMRTPNEFEKHVENLPISDRPKLLIHNGYQHLSTNNVVIDKKEKRSKKEKSQHQ